MIWLVNIFQRTLDYSEGQFHHSYVHLAQMAKLENHPEDEITALLQFLKYSGIRDKTKANNLLKEVFERTGDARASLI